MLSSKPRLHSILNLSWAMKVWFVNSICNSSNPRCKLWTRRGLPQHLRKVFCLGIIRKIGDLMRLAGTCINDGVCGLIRQYTWNLTRRRWFFNKRNYTGTAWLSSVRALEWDVKSSYEQNPHFNYFNWGLKSSQYGLYRLGDTRATCG